MSAERRERRLANQFRLTPEPCAAGAFKGYVGLDRISAASQRMGSEGRMTSFMHHISEPNLRQAFRKLDGNKASGIDQVTKSQYGKGLQTNLDDLLNKIARGGWRPKPARQVLIPKAQGGWRPLAVGCLEDKIVQTLVAKILEAVYDPIFHRHSFGFRTGRRAHQALARLYSQANKRGKHCVAVEMDIEKFFDNVDHDKLEELLRLKIGDEKFMRLIKRMLKNSVLEQGEICKDRNEGTPQGSPVSPVLANVYLHYALDNWFQETWAGKGEMVRYADDAVFVFDDEGNSAAFRQALEARLGEFGLRLNADKSGVRKFGPKDQSGDLPFLGFALYWGKVWGGKRVLKVKTLPKRLGRCIQDFKDWIKASRHRWPLDELWEKARAKIVGHYNYYGVTGNLAKLNHFYYACKWLLFRWLNRRSQKHSFTWESFERRLLFKPIPAPTRGALIVDIENGLGTELNRKPKSRVRKLRTHGSVRSSGRQRPLFT